MGFVISLTAALAVVTTAGFQDAVHEWQRDAETLKLAGIALDAPGLRQYLADQADTSAQPSALAALREKLGDRNFQVREQATKELVRLGRQALPTLRAIIKEDPEENRRRAEKCLQRIEVLSHPDLLQAAVRRLSGQATDDLLATLMHFLPQAGSEETSDQVRRLLHQAMKRQGRLDPAVAQYVADEAPARRAAAAFLTASLGSAKQRQDLLKQLDNQQFEVRYQAARGCLTAGDKAALPLLLDVLERGPLPLATLAQERLHQVADLKGPGDKAPATEAERQQAHAAWKKWHEEQAAVLVLKAAGLQDSPSEQKAQARRIADQFFKATVAKDIATLDRLTKFPFYSLGGGGGLRKETRESMIKSLQDSPPQPDMSFKVSETVSLAAVKKILEKMGPDGIEVLGKEARAEFDKGTIFRANDWYVMGEMRIKEPNISIRLALVVRPHGDRLYVIGAALIGFDMGKGN